MSTKAQHITETLLKKQYYSDFFNNFLIHPNKRDLAVLKNEDAVKRSVKNLLLTNKGEKPYDNNYGCNIRRYLFDLVDDTTIENIKTEIRSAIENYEQRAEIYNLDVGYDDRTHELTIFLEITIINNDNPIALNLVVNRIR